MRRLKSPLQAEACSTKNVISRRALFVFPALAACSRRSPGFDGYAFVANQEGQAVAAVDLGALAVAKHIPLDAAPTEIAAAATRPAVYALTPATGTIHEIETAHLRLGRSIGVGSQPACMRVAYGEKSLYVLTREPNALCAISTETMPVDWRIPLAEPPAELELNPDATLAAVSSDSGLRLIDLRAPTRGETTGGGPMGTLRFLSDGKTLIAGHRDEPLLSVFNVAASLRDPRD